MGQKRKNIVFFVRMAAFLIIFGLLFAPLRELVCRKSLTGTWDMTNKVGGFYNEPEDEFEILFLGSSHSYAAFSPLRLWEDTGIKSYVFATQRQPLWATYAYLLEALKTQSPKLVVVDCRGALEPAESFYEEGVSYSFMDDIPFSLNKVRLAWVSGQTMEERAELLCNFIKYHGRWADLEDADWEFDRGALHDPYKGYVFLPDKAEEYPCPETGGITARAPLDGKNEYWLRRIIEHCQKRQLPLLLVKTPSNLSAEEKALVNTVAAIAGEYDVPFADFNGHYAEIGLDASMFFDEHHMDARGAAKFTDYFAAALERDGTSLGFSRAEGDRLWADSAAEYEEKLTSLL